MPTGGLGLVDVRLIEPSQCLQMTVLPFFPLVLGSAYLGHSRFKTNLCRISAAWALHTEVTQRVIDAGTKQPACVGSRV